MYIFIRFCKVFWPLLFLVFGGGFLHEAIIDSIKSTPHPSLIYGIFFIFCCSTLLLIKCIYRFAIEYKIACRTYELHGEQRSLYLNNLKFRSDFSEFYDVLIEIKNIPVNLIQNSLENEIEAGGERMVARLEMPEFLGGALVGVGLVGTFVGLLSTLQELGGLFSSINFTSGSSEDTMALFGELIQSLQKPLKGMGTAFVASLYGLLGSLVIGLMTNSSRNISEFSLSATRKLIKQCINAQLLKNSSLPMAETLAIQSSNGLELPYYLKLIEGLETLKNTALLMAKNQERFGHQLSAEQYKANQLLANLSAHVSPEGDIENMGIVNSSRKVIAPENNQLSKLNNFVEQGQKNHRIGQYIFVFSVLVVISLTILALSLIFKFNFVLQS